jgi:hypothetical protein
MWNSCHNTCSTGRILVQDEQRPAWKLKPPKSNEKLIDLVYKDSLECATSCRACRLSVRRVVDSVAWDIGSKIPRTSKGNTVQQLRKSMYLMMAL